MIFEIKKLPKSRFPDQLQHNHRLSLKTARILSHVSLGLQHKTPKTQPATKELIINAEKTINLKEHLILMSIYASNAYDKILY